MPDCGPQPGAREQRRANAVALPGFDAEGGFRLARG